MSRRVGHRAGVGYGIQALLATMVCALGGLLAAAVAQAAEVQPFAVKKFEAGTCSPVNKKAEEGTERESTEMEVLGQCEYQALERELTERTPPAAYTQADGHPKYGITAFEFDNKEISKGHFTMYGVVHGLRVDLPPGLSVNTLSVPRCPIATFQTTVVGKEGAEDACPANTNVGENFVEAVLTKLGGLALPLELPIYNLQPASGLPLEVGIYNSIGEEHEYLEGHLSWHRETGPGAPQGIATGDYHEFFTIHDLPDKAGGSLPVAVKRIVQVFYGNNAGSGFLRLPSACGRESTRTHVIAESYDHAEDRELTERPVTESSEATTLPPAPLAVDGCAKVPFAPALAVSSKVTTSDAPSGLQVEVTAKQNEKASEIGYSDIRNVTVTLPEGLTINPAAAAGIEGCTPEEIAGESSEHASYKVECPEGSEIGTVELETPELPAGTLTGGIYLGKPASGSITEPPYTIYIAAENTAQYGVAVRLKGIVRPNPLTGQLETSFEGNPQLPFTALRLHFRGGPLAPLANPLGCGASAATSSFTPFTGFPSSLLPEAAAYPVSGCEGTKVPFKAPELSQSAAALPKEAARNSTFTTSITRQQGQQFIAQVQTTLPAGVAAQLPNTALCAEAAANAGTCSAESKIGEVAVQVGSGGAPFTFNGGVYMTERYGGAPFGLSIVVPANVGPFSLGNVVTRAKVQIDPRTARVSVTATLPTIVGGIPIRLRGFTLAINRPNFELNPTNCSPEATETQLSGTTVLPPAVDATVSLSSPFQAEGCAALPFSPGFTAATSATTDRRRGAELLVAIRQPAGQANIASVTTTLPAQLPSRQSTLNQACAEEQAAANILACPASSLVGHAEVTTPTLPGVLKGPAYLVSHGGHAFPDIELVLEGDGVRVLLIGNTSIKAGITTSSFADNPDVPISSFSLSLPMAANSLLSFNGSLCDRPLAMPTTIVAQNGKRILQTTAISVAGCLPVLTHRAFGRYAIVTVKAPAAGRIAMRGFGLKLAVRRSGRAGLISVRVPLSAAGMNALHARHRFRTRVRIGFLPKKKGGAAFVSYAALSFR